MYRYSRELNTNFTSVPSSVTVSRPQPCQDCNCVKKKKRESTLSVQKIRNHQQLQRQLWWDVHIRHIHRILILFSIIKILANLLQHNPTKTPPPTLIRITREEEEGRRRRRGGDFSILHILENHTVKLCLLEIALLIQHAFYSGGYHDGGFAEDEGVVVI